jgi:hypothetical protein
MNVDDFLAGLTKKEFLNEIHHLLWIPSFQKGKVIDLGWNCRDHALLIAGMAILSGLTVKAVTGKVAFIQGPRLADGLSPFGVEQLTHTWLNIDEIGTCDLSANTRSVKKFHGATWAFIGVVGSKVVPSGSAQYFLTTNELKYNTVFDTATDLSDQFTVVYLAKKIEAIEAGDLDASFRWCNSPLTNRLKNLKVPAPAYRWAAEHLLRIIDGEQETLLQLPQMKAWSKLAERER